MILMNLMIVDRFLGVYGGFTPSLKKNLEHWEVFIIMKNIHHIGVNNYIY